MHLNENGIGSWPDPFFRCARKNAVWGRDSQYLVTSSMQRRKVLWCAVTTSRQKRGTQGMMPDKTSQPVDRREAHRGWCLTNISRFFLVMPVQGPETRSFRMQFQYTSFWSMETSNYYTLSDVLCMQQDLSGLVITYCKVGIFCGGDTFCIFCSWVRSTKI